MAKKIYFLQNEATPHNNQFIKDLQEINRVKLDLWYARGKSLVCGWDEDLTNKFQKASIFGDRYPNLVLLLRLMVDRKSIVLITGWQNITLKLLVVLSFITRRKINIWLDMPQITNESMFKTLLRALWYLICRSAPIKFFCVNSATIKFIKDKGMKSQNVILLPVSVYSADDNFTKSTVKDMRIKHNVDVDQFLVVSGSRLVKEKGFDLLIDAIALMPPAAIAKTKVIVFGRGPEEESLVSKIQYLGLSDVVVIIGWLDVAVMRALIYSADLFVHPARWDAYGPGTLNAMSLGTPVIATTTSGSGPELIRHKDSGWLYEAEDYKTLTNLLVGAMSDKIALEEMSVRAKLRYEHFCNLDLAEIVLNNAR